EAPGRRAYARPTVGKPGRRGSRAGAGRVLRRGEQAGRPRSTRRVRRRVRDPEAQAGRAATGARPVSFVDEIEAFKSELLAPILGAGRMSIDTAAPGDAKQLLQIALANEI